MHGPLGRRSAGMSCALVFALFLALFPVLPAAAADAARDGPDAYANLVPVSVSGKQAIVQLPLPRAVYLGARAADLRDLRLFDAGGAPMPFALVDRVQQDQVSTSSAPASIFPVRAPAGAARGLPEGLQIRTREDGAVISVTAPAARSPDDVLVSLVLDLRPPAGASPDAGADAATTLSALSLALPRGVDNYSARVVLEASDDLQRWETLAEASVSWLVNQQGASVHRNRIELDAQPFRYARLRWLDGEPLAFAAISAEYRTRVRAAQQWDSIVLQAEAGAGGDGVRGDDPRIDDLVYAAPPAIPVEAVGVVFRGQNVVLPALIGQYRELPGGGPGRKPDVDLRDLRPVASATFYQLTQDGRARTSGNVEVPVTHASRWVLRPRAKVGERPALRLRWKPATLVFVAGGKGPYTLAFGRSGAQPASRPLAQVAPGFSPHELAALEQARVGEPVRRQAGTGAADAQPGVLQDRTLWLWALLICGVAALALMAWRLQRQLKDESAGPPPA